MRDPFALARARNSALLACPSRLAGSSGVACRSATASNPARTHNGGRRAGALDRLRQPASHLHGSRGRRRWREHQELTACGASDGIGRTAGRLKQPRGEIDEDRRRRSPRRALLRLGLHGERHTGERRVPAIRVRDQLARAPLQSPFRVQSARRRRILFQHVVGLELDAGKPVHLQQQLLGVDPEAEIVPRSGLERREPLLLGRRRRGDHEHGSVPRNGPKLPQLAAHNDAVQVLEICVHEDHVRPYVGRVLQQLAPAGDGQDPVSLRAEHAVEGAREPRATVSDEDDGYADERRALRQGRALGMRACGTA